MLKPVFAALAAVVLSLSAFTAHARPAPPVTAPPLWKIEKDGRTAYLFGTIHLGIALSELPENVRLLLAGAGTVYLEADLRRGHEAITKDLIQQPEGKRLSDSLSSTAWGLFLDITQMPANEAQKLTPFTASMLLGASRTVVPTEEMMEASEGVEEGNMDIEIYQARAAANLPLGFLEEPHIPQSVLDMTSEALEALILEKPWETGARILDTTRQLGDLVRAYRSGDFEKFGHKSLAQLTPEQLDNVFTKRNHAWLPVMEKAMTEGTPVFAAGAAHMLGEDGLVDLLEKRGYKVERVTDCAALFAGKAS